MRRMILVKFMLTGLMLITITLIQAKGLPQVKVAANLGLVNGGTVSILVGQNEKSSRNSYVCFNYMTRKDYTTYGGINYTEQRSWNDRFYFLWSGGFDAGKIVDWSFNPGGPDEDEPEYKSFIIPHITFGLGYNFARWDKGSAFVEWDLGIKASISNINLGVTF